MACKCPVCRNKETPGHAIGREDRLRGFEIEFSQAGIETMLQPGRCAKHLIKCKDTTKCPARNRGVGGIGCDCLACVYERGEKPKPFECPGHGCLEVEGRGSSATWLTKKIIEGVGGAFPVQGDLTQHHGTPRDNDFWHLKRDGSCGYEVATPPVEGRQTEDLLAGLMTALTKEEERHGGSMMDNACGLHVTFDVRDVGVRGVKKILLMSLRHQAALVATQPLYRRNNQTCKFASKHPKMKKNVAKARRPEQIGGNDTVLQDRYMFINLNKVYNGTGLIEFRFGGATTDWKRIEAYGVLIECLIEAALRRPVMSGTADRKKKMFQEVVEPFMGDERVKKAWGILGRQLEEAELARV